MSNYYSSRKKAPRYIEKIGEGSNARYFYTEKELDAYYNRGKSKSKRTDADKAEQRRKDLTGETAREKRNKIKSTTERLKDRAVGLRDEVASKEKKAKTIKEKAEVVRLRKEYERAYRMLEIYNNKFLRDAQEKYARTPLGKIEAAKGKMKDAMNGVRDYLSENLNNIERWQNTHRRMTGHQK